MTVRSAEPTTEEPAGNEFLEALTILNRYYRSMVIQLAEEVVENEREFDVPLLGNAESLVEKYAQPLNNLAALHETLKLVGAALFAEKITRLREDEYLCFGCRAIVRKVERSCPKCGWTWKSK